MKKIFLFSTVFIIGFITFGLNGTRITHGARLEANPPTFNKEVVRIFQQNCQSCHHPGYIAPFSLMAYQDAKPYAEAIKVETQAHRMPPWKAAQGCGDMNDARVLSKDQIDTLTRWTDAGAPEGDPKDLPEPLTFTSNWLLGTPDLELSSTESYNLPGEGDDIYRCFVMPYVFTEDKYVVATEVLPDAREVVHHVLIFLDGTGTSLKLDAADPGPGYTSFGGPGFTPVGGLGGWAPGSFPRFTPKGIGIRVPKGSRVVMQVHYHLNGKPQSDKTRIGLHFATEPIESNLQSFPILNPFFRIPPGNNHYKVKAQFWVPPTVNIQAIGVTPHMHLLGRQMKVQAVLPTGQKVCLVNIPDWDFRWQGTYTYKEPVKLPAGTILEATAYYDNSTNNLRNPNNPPKTVGWGEQTTDEMCLAFISYIVDKGANTNAASRPAGEIDDIQRQLALSPPITMGGVDIMEQAKLRLASNLLSTSPVEMYNWSAGYQPEVNRILPWAKFFCTSSTTFGTKGNQAPPHCH